VTAQVAVPLAKLGQFHVPALDAARVQKSRDYRMLTSSWIVAPWELNPEPQPRKRAG
jgi:hypothetical protein